MPDAIDPSVEPAENQLHQAANEIAGLLDDDGQYNPNGQKSRAHPDYDEKADKRQSRDTKGRFRRQKDEQSDDTDSGRSEYIEQDDEDQDEDEDKQRITEDGDEPDEDADEDGDTDEDRATSDDEDNEDEEDTDAFESLEQLADALEIGIDDLKDSLKLKFRAANEDVEVTLSEAIAGYQKDADYRRSTAKLAEDRRNAEVDYAGRMQAYDQQNVLLSQQFQVLEQMIGSELNDPRLAQLRESDPGEWTARREEIGQRLNVVRNLYQQNAANYQQFVDNQRAQLRDREMGYLTQKIPDFSAEHRAKAKDVMASIGYSGQEIGNILDHRVVAAALEMADLRSEVAELRELKKQGEDSARRVKKKVPKTQKPGKSTQGKGKRVKVKKDTLSRLRDRAKRTGRTEDAAKVLEHFI